MSGHGRHRPRRTISPRGKNADVWNAVNVPPTQYLSRPPPWLTACQHWSNSTPSWWSWRLPQPVLYPWTAVTVGWSHCTRQNHTGSSRSVGQGFVPSGTHKAWLRMPQASQLKSRLGNFALLSGLSMYLQCFRGLDDITLPVSLNSSSYSYA